MVRNHNITVKRQERKCYHFRRVIRNEDKNTYITFPNLFKKKVRRQRRSRSKYGNRNFIKSKVLIFYELVNFKMTSR